MSSTPGRRSDRPVPPTAAPPSGSQPDQPPAYHLCHTWPSVPRAATSIRPTLHDVAAGSPPSAPPRGCHPDQPPEYHLCHSWLSVPRANTSSRPADHDDTAGPLLSDPPSGSQPVQWPANALCHSWLSVPRANTSIRPLLHDTAAGVPWMPPPRSSQPRKVPALKLCARCPALLRAKTSRRPGAHDEIAAPDVRPPLSGGAVSNAHHRPCVGAATARPRSSRPPVPTTPLSAATGCTFASRVVFSAAVDMQFDESISAAAPATCGAAIDVPSAVAYSAVGSVGSRNVERMSTPGAARSTVFGP